jgi:hypothetical protein
MNQLELHRKNRYVVTIGTSGLFDQINTVIGIGLLAALKLPSFLEIPKSGRSNYSSIKVFQYYYF